MENQSKLYFSGKGLKINYGDFLPMFFAGTLFLFFVPFMVLMHIILGVSYLISVDIEILANQALPFVLLFSLLIVLAHHTWYFFDLYRIRNSSIRFYDDHFIAIRPEKFPSISLETIQVYYKDLLSIELTDQGIRYVPNDYFGKYKLEDDSRGRIRRLSRQIKKDVDRIPDVYVSLPPRRMARVVEFLNSLDSQMNILSLDKFDKPKTTSMYLNYVHEPVELVHRFEMIQHSMFGERCEIRLEGEQIGSREIRLDYNERQNPIVMIDSKSREVLYATTSLTMDMGKKDFEAYEVVMSQSGKMESFVRYLAFTERKEPRHYEFDIKDVSGSYTIRKNGDDIVLATDRKTLLTIKCGYRDGETIFSAESKQGIEKRLLEIVLLTIVEYETIERHFRRPGSIIR